MNLHGKLAGTAVVVVLVVALIAWGLVSWGRAGQDQVNQALAAATQDVSHLSNHQPDLERFANASPAPPSFQNLGTAAALAAAGKDFDARMAVEEGQLAQQGALVNSDQDLVNDAITRLGNAESNPLTAFNHSRLDAELGRFGYERQALDNAGSIVSSETAQLKAINDLVDAQVGYAVVLQQARAHDLQAAQLSYTNVHSLLYKAHTDSEGANFDPVWDTFLADINKLVDDTNAEVEAAMAKDTSALSDAADIRADVLMLQGLDVQPLAKSAYLDSLLKQMRSNQSKAEITGSYNSL